MWQFGDVTIVVACRFGGEECCQSLVLVQDRMCRMIVVEVGFRLHHQNCVDGINTLIVAERIHLDIDWLLLLIQQRSLFLDSFVARIVAKGCGN